MEEKQRRELIKSKIEKEENTQKPTDLELKQDIYCCCFESVEIAIKINKKNL